jgi:penicillin V acylase-like amidase (Ntn superfamily)
LVLLSFAADAGGALCVAVRFGRIKAVKTQARRQPVPDLITRQGCTLLCVRSFDGPGSLNGKWQKVRRFVRMAYLKRNLAANA